MLTTALGPNPEFDRLATMARRSKFIWRKVARIIGKYNARLSGMLPGGYHYNLGKATEYLGQALNDTRLSEEIKAEIRKLVLLP